MSPLFQIHNTHPKIHGTPPAIDWDKALYCAYFNSERGDQWLCWRDQSGIHFAGGCEGWGKITSLNLSQLRHEVRLPIALSNAERLWFSACLSAIRGKLVFVVQG